MQILRLIGLLLATTEATRARRSTAKKSRPITSVESKHVTADSSTQPRRACRLYLWDAPSAFLSRWCKHLQKDCEYEGLGGERFVRIRPGSILQLLYPCSRYSQDKCLICGGKYVDHLTLWWFKHMYSPLDGMLDRDFEQGVIRPDPPSPTLNRKGKSRNRTGYPQLQHVHYPRFVYHRRYVLDISDMIDNLKEVEPESVELSKSAKAIQRAFEERYPGHQETDATVAFPDRILNWELGYMIPERNSRGDMASFPVSVVRGIVLGTVGNLVRLEARDRKKRM